MQVISQDDANYGSFLFSASWIKLGPCRVAKWVWWSKWILHVNGLIKPLGSLFSLRRTTAFLAMQLCTV